MCEILRPMYTLILTMFLRPKYGRAVDIRQSNQFTECEVKIPLPQKRPSLPEPTNFRGFDQTRVLQKFVYRGF